VWQDRTKKEREKSQKRKKDSNPRGKKIIRWAIGNKEDWGKEKEMEV